MTPKKLQKAFNISNEQTKNYIDRRIEDIATANYSSTSFILENAVLSSLLPKNEEARKIIFHHLYPVNGEGVKETLDAIFDYNSAGLDWNSKHSNFLPLVEFCLQYVKKSAMLSDTNTIMHHLLNQFSSIVDVIERCSQHIIDPFDEAMYKNKSSWARKIYDNAKEKPSDIPIVEIFEIIKDCWVMLDDWSITYRLLSDLAAVSEFEESVESRNALVDTISEVSKSW